MRRCCENDLPPVDYGAKGFPEVFVDPEAADWDSILFRRWGSGGAGPFHTFVDDWRQETFWRNWPESVVHAVDAGICTAPDFSIYLDDPLPLVIYQSWRSRVINRLWLDHGVIAIPVLQWGGQVATSLQGIRKGSVVAVRGPRREIADEWYGSACLLEDAIEPGLVMQFGNSYGSDAWRNVIHKRLNPSALRKGNNAC